MKNDCKEIVYEKKPGVPRFSSKEFAGKTKDYVVLIPIINEGDRIQIPSVTLLS